MFPVRTAALFASLIALPVCLLAQVKGTINGTVVDSAKAAVPGASLTLSSKETGEVRTAESSAQGYFNFIDLNRGTYRLTIKASGFRELIIDPVELTVGEQKTVHPTLEVGSVSEVVEVTSAAPPVTTSSSSVSQLVDSKRIEQLPLNGRNALQLVALLPGVVNAGAAGQFGNSHRHCLTPYRGTEAIADSLWKTTHPKPHRFTGW